MSDLISREAHLDLLAAVIAANSGTVLRLPGTDDTLTMGELTEQVDALRALPAAPEAGEAALPLIADYLRAPHMDAKREIDQRAREWIDGNPDPWVSSLSSERDALQTRLAEAEAAMAAAQADYERRILSAFSYPAQDTP